MKKTGVMEQWSTGVLHFFPIAPILQHSITPEKLTISGFNLLEHYQVSDHG
jgi:hypothetical protein